MKLILSFLFSLCILLNSSNSHAEQIIDLRNDLLHYIELKTETDGNTKIWNIPVYIPEVEEFPVLRVKLITGDDSVLEPNISNAGYINRDGFFFRKRPDDFDVKSKDAGVIAQKWYDTLWEESKKSKSSQVYADGQAYSLHDALEEMVSEIKSIYHDEIGVLPFMGGVKSRYLKKVSGKLDEVTSNTYPCGELTGIGNYEVRAWPTLKGIPVFFGSELYLNVFHRDDPLADFLRINSTIEYWEFFSNEWRSLYTRMIWGIDEVLVDDVPLCSFDRIEESIIEMANKGEIENIYNIQLGYVIYADSNIKYSNKRSEIERQEFLAIPTWIAMVSQSNHSKSEIHNSSSYDYYSLDPGFMVYRWNAQNGMLFDINNHDINRYYAPDIQLWDDWQIE